MTVFEADDVSTRAVPIFTDLQTETCARMVFTRWILYSSDNSVILD